MFLNFFFLFRDIDEHFRKYAPLYGINFYIQFCRMFNTFDFETTHLIKNSLFFKNSTKIIFCIFLTKKEHIYAGIH